MFDTATNLSDFEDLISGSVSKPLSTLTKAAPIKTQEEIRREWLMQRWGRMTASKFSSLMTYENKDGLPAGAITYIEKIAAQRISTPTDADLDDGFATKAIVWGRENEVDGLMLAQRWFAIELADYGDNQQFLTLGDYLGATPDAVDSDGCVHEIKCPDTATHCRYRTILSAADLKAIEPTYYWQVIGEMQCYESDYAYFHSYDPRMNNPAKRLHSVLIARDEIEHDLQKLIARQKMAIEHIKKYVEING